MRIVRVIARLNVGGPAKHVVWLTAGLERDDCTSLLVAGIVPEGEEDMGYFASEQGVEPFFIQEMSREISLKDVLTIWKLYRLLLRERPDIVHTHTAKAGTVGRIAGLLYRWTTPSVVWGRARQCRLIHTYHGHIFHGYYGPIRTRLFLLIEKLLAFLGTDRIIVVSEQQRHEIHEHYGVGRASQFAVIPLGLDLTIFAESESRRQHFRQELNAAEDDLLIGIVGRLTEIKDHELFLRAAALLIAHLPEAQRRLLFVVIGDGARRASLESLARSLHLEDKVTFVGTRRDPENFYPALDIVSLTSRNEGTPLTLIEAMANARPVIAASVGGVVDLLGEVQWSNGIYSICERGISVKPNDAPSFAKGLARMIEDTELRRKLGERGLQFVGQNHRKDRLVDNIRALYLELLEKKVSLSARATKRMESRI